MVFITHPPGRVVDLFGSSTSSASGGKWGRGGGEGGERGGREPVKFLPPQGGFGEGASGRKGGDCCFCRRNSPGIALSFHQVSSRTPEISIRKSFFLACVCGAENLCLCETETLCLWGTETRSLWGAETLSLGSRDPVSLRNRGLVSVRNTEPGGQGWQPPRQNALPLKLPLTLP